jgi:hypothetical protein
MTEIQIKTTKNLTSYLKALDKPDKFWLKLEGAHDGFTLLLNCTTDKHQNSAISQSQPQFANNF